MRVAILTSDDREHYKDYSAPVPYFGAAPEALLQGLADQPDLEVHVVSCTRQPMASPAKLASNISFHSLHVPRLGWMRTLYFGCIRAVRRQLKQLQPDIVHGQGTERDCGISAVCSGFPNVITIHGNMAELARLFHARIGSFSWLAARLEELALSRTAGVFCNSQYTEALVSVRAERVWRVPNALRSRFFAPGPGERPRQRCTLINIGVVSPRKRQLELLDVAAALRRQKLDFELVFIGRADPATPYAAAFLEKLKPLQADGIVRFVGPRPVDELIEWMDRANALVHFPSEEAFGLVVAEALARNMKLFAAAVGGVVDIASGAAGAELLPAADWQGLTQAIANWIKRGFVTPKDAAETMRARYHPAVIARKHREVYQEVLSKLS